MIVGALSLLADNPLIFDLSPFLDFSHNIMIPAAITPHAAKLSAKP